MFSGVAPQIPSSDLPAGASSACNDVAFEMGAWLTRPGILKALSDTTNPTSNFNYVKSFIDAIEESWIFGLDSFGDLFVRNPVSGAFQTGVVGIDPGIYGESTSAFQREWFAIGDGKFGKFPPFKATPNLNNTPPTLLFERLSQSGPGAAPTGVDEAVSEPITTAPDGLLAISSTITALTQAGDVVTVTATPLTAIGAIQPGDLATIAGNSDGYDGTFPVLAVLGSGIQVVNPTLGLPPSSGGTLTTGIVGIVPTTSLPVTEGQSVTVASATDPTYDGTFVVRFVNLGTIFVYNPAGSGSDSGDGTVTIAGGITAGTRGITVFFRTDQGYDTAPAVPPTFWISAGGLRVIVSNIPRGPANVVARVICFTAAGGADYYFVPTSMILQNNTSTTMTIDFTDAELLSGTPIASYFRKVVLGEVSSIVEYSDRLFSFGERQKLDALINMDFDGGWNLGAGTGGSDIPLGWASDPTDGAGGSRDQTIVVWNDAYRITGDGTDSPRGMITQPAKVDWLGNTLLDPAVAYSARIRLVKGGGTVGGSMRMDAFSPSTTVTYGSFDIDLGVVPSGTVFKEFIGSIVLNTTNGPYPSDLQLRYYAFTTLPNAGYVVADCLEIFPTNTPYYNSSNQASNAENPESFDGETGIQVVSADDGQRLVTGFQIRNGIFYLVKENALYSTQDTGNTEPSSWSIQQISGEAGTPSVNGVGQAEEWVCICGRSGAYIFHGGQPVKISQEIQPLWDQINWKYGYTLWCRVDIKAKRILIGVPFGTATSPNLILYMDYQGLDSAEDIISYHSVRYSSYSGKILVIGDARKWSPWNITAASAALVENPDGTLHTYLGNGLGNGGIDDLLDDQTTDNGAAIPWSYGTYYMPGHLDEAQLQLGSGRKIIGYLAGFVEGSGNMAISAQPLGNITPTPCGNVSLIEQFLNTLIASITRIKFGYYSLITVVTAEPHGLVQGIDNQAVLAGVADNTFNGTWPMKQVVNPTTFILQQNAASAGPTDSSSGGTVTRLLRDFELTVNVTGERIAFTFSNQGNVAGSWCRMQKFIPWMGPDPNTPTRGII